MRRFVEYRQKDDSVDVQLTEGAMHVSLDLSPDDARALAADIDDVLQEVTSEPAAQPDAEDEAQPSEDDDEPDTPEQRVLEALQSHGGELPQADLPDELELTEGTVSYRLGRMEDDDLVERERMEGSAAKVVRLPESEPEPKDEASGSDYVIDNPEGYIATLRVSRSAGLSTGIKELTDILGLKLHEEVTYWRQDGAIHVVGPDGPSPPARADFVRTATIREESNRLRFTLSWGPLKQIGATDGGDAKLFDRGDRVVVRAVDEDGQLLGEDYDPEEPASPLADDDSPHKYSTGREPIRFVDYDNLEDPPSLDTILADVPDGVTPERIQAAVQSGECHTIDDVCAFIGVEVDGNGHPIGAMRDVLQRLDLYDELLDPEGDRRQRGRSDA